MARKEVYHLAGGRLEVDFSGDESVQDDFADFRPRFKKSLMQHLVSDGAVFEDREAASNWKANGGADTRVEAAIDTWIRDRGYKCTKAKDKQSKKVRWILEGEEQVTILAFPE